MANHHLKKLESWVNIENNNFPEQKFLENSTSKKTWNVSWWIAKAIKQQQKKIIKSIRLLGRRKTVFFHRWCSYEENPKQSTKKFQELVSDYSKVVETRLLYKSQSLFLHTSSEQAEFEIMPYLTFILASLLQMKYFCINLTNYV